MLPRLAAAREDTIGQPSNHAVVTIQHEGASAASRARTRAPPGRSNCPHAQGAERGCRLHAGRAAAPRACLQQPCPDPTQTLHRPPRAHRLRRSMSASSAPSLAIRPTAALPGSSTHTPAGSPARARAPLGARRRAWRARARGGQGAATRRHGLQHRAPAALIAQ